MPDENNARARKTNEEHSQARAADFFIFQHFIFKQLKDISQGVRNDSLNILEKIAQLVLFELKARAT